jgi:hypothetical protein
MFNKNLIDVVKLQERERIFALLEVWAEEEDQCFCCANDAAVANIIAFIRDEVKGDK